jgi:zinc transport system substrate-binding protein
MRLTLALAALFASSSLCLANVNVVATIKPIHSLVAQVMEGVGTPALLVDGANSPHTYVFKPSDAAKLQDAQVIFWVGHELEAFLEKPIAALGGKAMSVSLIDAAGVETLPVREGAGFAGHAHEEAEHKHEAADAHFWLDPQNAKAVVKAVAATLSKADGANAATYEANAVKALAALDAVEAEIAAKITPAKGPAFIVFHDAYQYFERRFGVSAAGAISINPENAPGAKGIAEIKARLSDGQIKCVFAEPQFDAKLVTLVLEGTQVKTATLDPLGADVEPGPALYPTLLNGIANSLVACLAPKT